MPLQNIAWILGCANMGISMAFSAIAHHSKKMDDIVRTSMHRAVTIHQISALGFILLSLAY